MRKHLFFILLTLSLIPKMMIPQSNVSVADNTSKSMTVDKKDRYYKNIEGNKMIIITVPKFGNELNGYIQWKRERGLEVELDVSSALQGADAIKEKLREKYYNGGLTYIILIGDIDDVPSIEYQGLPSDPSYALLAGDDLIGDALISRISCNNTAELHIQLKKILIHEKGLLVNSEWISNALIAGTVEFDGAAHCDEIERAMKDHPDYFERVIKVLETDSDPKKAVIDAIENIGVNVIVYNTHGFQNGFTNIPFSVKDAKNLQNFDNGFPMIFGAACLTGSFSWADGDCFAEAIMKAGTVEKPAGAVAMFALVDNGNPAPAMVAQRKAFTDLYFTSKNLTFGALCYYANLHAISQLDGYEAERFCRQWHFFGDCSTPITKPVLKIPALYSDKSHNEMAYLLENNKKEKMSMEERKELFTERVVESGYHGRPEYAMGLLIDSIDKLKESIEDSSKSANKLTKKIKWLTWVLVFIGIISD